jgi:hypothetical protein
MRIVGPIVEISAPAKARRSMSAEKVSGTKEMAESAGQHDRRQDGFRAFRRQRAPSRNETHRPDDNANTAPQARFVAQVLGQIMPVAGSDAGEATRAYARAAHRKDMRFIRWA